MNDTHGHRWALHEHPPGADYYNWSRRCESAGAEWEPRAPPPDPRRDAYCALPPLCRLGDLAARSARRPFVRSHPSSAAR